MISNYNIKYPSIKAKVESVSDTQYKLIVSPLLPGFGHTLGNSLRRAMLSSIPGFAVTKVRINDLTHEYQAVAGTKEDALEILLNLKELKAVIKSDEKAVTLTLKHKKEGLVTAADFDKNSSVEIINTDLHICNLSKGGTIEIEIEVTRGIGYLSLENRDMRGTKDPKSILIDAVFSPVNNVMFVVDQTRVGDKTDYDKIVLDYTTNGTVTGEEAAEYVLKLLSEMNANMLSAFQSAEAFEDVVKVQKKEKKSEEEGEKIDLPSRIIKILDKNGIKTIDQLKERAGEVKDFAGVGAKAVEKVEEYVKGLK